VAQWVTDLKGIKLKAKVKVKVLGSALKLTVLPKSLTGGRWLDYTTHTQRAGVGFSKGDLAHLVAVKPSIKSRFT